MIIKILLSLSTNLAFMLPVAVLADIKTNMIFDLIDVFLGSYAVTLPVSYGFICLMFSLDMPIPNEAEPAIVIPTVIG